MGIVHAHAAHPGEALKRTGAFETVDTAILGQAQGQLAIGAGSRRVDLVVVRAVHGLEVVFFTHYLFLTVGTLMGFFQDHGREHGFGVHGQVTGGLVKALLGDLGSGNPFVARLEFKFMGQLLKLLTEHGAVGQPQGQALAYLVVQVEEVELGAQLTVIVL